MPKVQTAVGKAIRCERERLGLSRERAAQLLGMSRGALQRLESDEAQKPNSMLALATLKLATCAEDIQPIITRRYRTKKLGPPTPKLLDYSDGKGIRYLTEAECEAIWEEIADGIPH